MSVSLPPAVPGAVPGTWRGGTLSDRVRCLLAPNPGPMTLDGTNTFVLGEPGSTEVVVVDPGPNDTLHLTRVLDDVASREQRVALVVLTHGHPDHAAGAGELARRAGCPVRAVDPAHRRGPDGLSGGDQVRVGGLVLDVVATPGHTADSACLVLADEPALLTGDTVLGRGTTVVAHPDGRLADYLDSLARIESLAVAMPDLRLLPGHGPAAASVQAVASLYRAHRAARLEQVVDAVRAGAADVDGVVATVYQEVDRSLWPAAKLSVLAQVDYLLERGRLRVDQDRLSVRDA